MVVLCPVRRERQRDEDRREWASGEEGGGVGRGLAKLYSAV